MKIRELREEGRSILSCLANLPNLSQVPPEQIAKEVDLILLFTLAENTEKDLSWLLINLDLEVSEQGKDRAISCFNRRAESEPVASIFGEKEFYGRIFEVSRDVLIPRPETELLVELALEKARMLEPPILVLEIGVGSGCVMISLVLELMQEKEIASRPIEYWASDISEKAIEVAKSNAEKHACRDKIRWFSGDLFEAFPKLDDSFKSLLVVSNPPYIGKGDCLPRDVSQFEPAQALFAEKEGFEIIEQIIQGVERFSQGLAGFLLLEIGYTQGSSALECSRRAGLGEGLELHQDLAGHDRVAEIKLQNFEK